MDAALSTPELLEAILLQLDPRTLLVSAQRVSTYWHGLIAASISLQQALFLAPEDHSLFSGSTSDFQCFQRRQNPLLVSRFPAWFENTPSFFPNPKSGVNPVHRYPSTATRAAARFEELPLFQKSLESVEENPFLHPAASWRRMLTSQPPCRTICTNSKVGPGPSMVRQPGQSSTIRLQDGLRMGQIYDMTLGHAAQYQESGFMVIWIHKVKDVASGTTPFGRRPRSTHEVAADTTLRVDLELMQCLERHLRRLTGRFLQLTTESALFKMWDERPDLFVQMLHREDQQSAARAGLDLTGALRISPTAFWKKCGLRAVDDDNTATCATSSGFSNAYIAARELYSDVFLQP